MPRMYLVEAGFLLPLLWRTSLFGVGDVDVVDDAIVEVCAVFLFDKSGLDFLLFRCFEERS